MGVDYGVASSWSKSTCNPRELEWSPKNIVSFRGEHPKWVQTSQLAPISSKGKPLGSQMIDWNFNIYTK